MCSAAARSRRVIFWLLTAGLVGCKDNGAIDGELPASGGKHSAAAAGADDTVAAGRAGSSVETGGGAAGGGTDHRTADGGVVEEDAGAHDAGSTGEPADSGSDSASVNGWPEGKYIAADDVYERLQSGDPDLLLVNVVDEEFYYLGHIAGSLMIPWDTLEDHLDEIDPDRHVVVYCRKGVRSESAYPILTDNGYAWVWVMEGGLEAWTAQGYTTVTA
jgi:rhodanese-related sulfurtransferase